MTSFTCLLEHFPILQSRLTICFSDKQYEWCLYHGMGKEKTYVFIYDYSKCKIILWETIP